MQFAKPLDQIPPYLFAELDRKRTELTAKGVDIINMGVGDPDKPTPDHVIQAMIKAVQDPSNHNYPPYQGTRAYREAAAEFMARRFGVTGLDPDTQIVSSIGSKEAIHNIFLAFVEPGDYVLIPDPAYPVYRTSTIFAGRVKVNGEVVRVLGTTADPDRDYIEIDGKPLLVAPQLSYGFIVKPLPCPPSSKFSIGLKTGSNNWQSTKLPEGKGS